MALLFFNRRELRFGKEDSPKNLLDFDNHQSQDEMSKKKSKEDGSGGSFNRDIVSLSPLFI